MPNAYDITWGGLVGLTAPIWLAIPKTRRKVLKAFRQRMARDLPAADTSRRAVMIHAVSLGEINATRAMVSQLTSARPDLRIIITTTTDTGFARGQELYGKTAAVTLLRFPLDFSSAINRLLDRLKPSVVVLMELEVWPNFVRHCERRNIPVLLVNGRLTPSSFASYRKGGALVRKMFRRVRLICAQEQSYADRFLALGAPPDRVHVTGTMKFDTAQVADRIEGADVLAAEVGLRVEAEPIWVCGSTGPGEEEIVLRVYRTLLDAWPALRLVIVPRHPERFDAVAQLIRDQEFELVRRSETVRTAINGSSGHASPNPILAGSSGPGSLPPVVLGDTMGELRKFFSLATVIFVGRSLVDLGPRQHGSDMIEPAALAKPVVVGPWTHNFSEPMNCFRAASAMHVAADQSDLAAKITDLLEHPEAAREMGRRAQDIVRREQGVTARHVAIILNQLDELCGKHGDSE